MSCVQLSEGWFYPLACGPGHPELSKSSMEMACKLFTFTFTLTPARLSKHFQHALFCEQDQQVTSCQLPSTVLALLRVDSA